MLCAELFKFVPLLGGLFNSDLKYRFGLNTEINTREITDLSSCDHMINE